MGIRGTRARRSGVRHTEFLHRSAWKPSGVCLAHLHVAGVRSHANAYSNAYSNSNANTNAYGDPNTHTQGYAYTETPTDSASSAVKN
jgi:hypothetical protein